MTEWFTETLHEHLAQRLEMASVVYRETTEHQSLVIFDNPTYGRVLALDGVVQTTTGEEFIYHEMLVHVPLIAHGSAREVLIIGGGDGGALRHCLMHPVERVTMVEIDRYVIDLCTRYMPELADGAFEDPRADLVIADGCRYVRETDRRFDAIIIDSTDPIGPGKVLFTPDFYADCKGCLKPDGVLVNQNSVPAIDGWVQAQTFRNLRPTFADVWAFSVAVPIYIGGIMTLGWATDDAGLRRLPVDEVRTRVARAGLRTRYYTPELHVASFALPRTVIDLMDAPPSVPGNGSDPGRP